MTIMPVHAWTQLLNGKTNLIGPIKASASVTSGIVQRDLWTVTDIADWYSKLILMSMENVSYF